LGIIALGRPFAQNLWTGKVVDLWQQEILARELLAFHLSLFFVLVHELGTACY
jgi:hypothetical protein